MSDGPGSEGELSIHLDLAGLAALLKAVEGSKGDRAIDRIKATKGYERALAAALGEDLDASLENEGSRRWSGAEVSADDYDAMTSEGPERAYKSRPISAGDAVRLLREGVERGRYEPRVTGIFIDDVLQYGG